MNTARIQYTIEQERSKLHQMKRHYRDFNHPVVLRQSVLLDELINQYFISLKSTSSAVK